ncbi:hypothetical protein SAMN06297387_11722 [Streptomyces zhaozhouensis]|uniref:Uncharacterized protein n=1 Tax=Streptomyces zhaozhouensis TaxID=1300267 RepID=A0A286E0L5_9ACTN|nr:hypothetical protein [Streptomyces zhaozhouensis]SOD64456.1 hypothetical protein SAMN06297387_11722 [Streptomyces zhaozhouensis]
MNAHLRTVTVAGLATLSLALAPGQPAAADSLGEARLREALLDPVDFPEGWASDSEEAAEKRGFGVPEPSERGCRELFDSSVDGSQSAGFAKTETGPFVTTTATDHGSAGEARAALAEFRAAAGRCETFHADEGPAGNAVTVAYEAQPGEAPGGLGDESTALRYRRSLDGEGAGTPVRVEVVVARVGPHLVRVAQAGRDANDEDELAPLAERAVAKLAEVASGGTPAPSPDQPGTTRL